MADQKIKLMFIFFLIDYYLYVLKMKCVFTAAECFSNSRIFLSFFKCLIISVLYLQQCYNHIPLIQCIHLVFNICLMYFNSIFSDTVTHTCGGEHFYCYFYSLAMSCYFFC